MRCQLTFDLFAEDADEVIVNDDDHTVRSVKLSEISKIGISKMYMKIEKSGTVVSHYELNYGRYAYIVSFADEENTMRHEGDFDCGSSKWIFDCDVDSKRYDDTLAVFWIVGGGRKREKEQLCKQ